MKRITIIIDEDTWDRLPQKGKSPFINLVLKNHFRKDSAEDLYKYLKQRLLQDFDLPRGKCVHGNQRNHCIHYQANQEGCNED